MRSPSLPSESAKEFLLSKVLTQAGEDGILLSDLERRMLSFSEGTASADDIEAAEQFDNEYDSDAYEAKIARLLAGHTSVTPSWARNISGMMP